ncbi:MAG: GNAT family N-acetyltransferase [Notoacmeibacter sp.]
MSLVIAVDDLYGPEIAALLQRHLDLMYEITPAGSVYALDLDRLRVPEITFWNARLSGQLVGCVALKEFGAVDNRQGEIKSMHTMKELRGKGIARALVAHLLNEAKLRGLKTLWLETGKTPPFMPAQKLYESFGFKICGPFGDYAFDKHSLYMTLDL